MKRSAQLFSLMAIFMSALMIVLFSGLTHVALNKDVDIIKTEIARFGTLAKSLDYFSNTALDTAGYMFFNNSADKLYQDCYVDSLPNCYFTNYTEAFLDCLNVGVYNGWNCSYKGNEKFNMSYYSRIKNLTNMLEERYSDLIINVTKPQLTVRQSGPYIFELNSELIIIMKRPGYSWKRFFNITRELSVVGMRDPALAARGMNKTIIVNGAEGDLVTVASLDADSTTKFAEIVNESYYFRDNITGLSITEMFEGIELNSVLGDSHPNGINSILPLKLVENATGYLENRSTTSLLEHHFLKGFEFTDLNSLYRFKNYYGVDDDIILEANFFYRAGVPALNYFNVPGCCGNDNDTYGLDGACDITCG